MADDIFPGEPTGPAHDALDRALRAEPGRVLSVLVRSLGDIDLAEDALQDAAATALARWPVEGVPTNPGGWLVTAARRRAIDRLRRTAVGRRKEAEAAAAVPAPGVEAGAPGGRGWPADEPLGDERGSVTPPSRCASRRPSCWTSGYRASWRCCT
jgi:RNA polymerase sigma-70 factor (ECF subfamily)